MKKFFVALLVLATVFSFVACEEKTPEPTAPAGYKTITSGTTVAQLKEYIADSNVKGIWAAEKVTINMEKADTLSISRDFGIENVAFVGKLPQGCTYPSTDSDGANKTHAIDITGTSSVTLKNVDFKDFTHALTIGGDSGTVDLTISGGTFDNCYKGLYASRLGDLEVSGVTMRNMGLASVASTGSDTGEKPKMDRSGAGFDIDQRTKGGSISITGSSFTNCGKTDTPEVAESEEGAKLTSGAIKIKVRPSYSAEANFESVEIIGNEFNNNRADIVLGTTNTDGDIENTTAAGTYPEELAAKTAIKNNTPATPTLDDNSGNKYEINEQGKLVPNNNEQA